MMKRLLVLLIFLLALGFALPVMGAEIEFHGDLNNRFQLYTNQNDFFRAEQQGIIRGNVYDNFGEAKYRFWTEAATNDGDVKGVFAVEIGGLRYGESSKGGGFSGDGINIETRWLYTDFQVPFIDSKNRLQMGLNTQTINQYFWAETVMGVKNYGTLDSIDYTLAWFRPAETNANESNQTGQDLDGFYGRINTKPTDDLLLGFFGLYFYKDDPEGSAAIEDRNYEIKKFATDAEFNMYTIGVDGGYNVVLDPGKLFFRWDAMYQGGKIKNASFTTTGAGDQTLPNVGGRANADFDVSAYFLHLDVGFTWDKSTLTYTFWYASGDDDPTDKDFEGYLAVDVDSFEDHILFESLMDDDVFTERYYLLDKGFVMNKLEFRHNWTEKFETRFIALYMLTAENIEYVDNDGDSQKNDEIGFELGTHLIYKLFPGLTFNLVGGYLFADDAMDYFEKNSNVNGHSDSDISRVMASFRYKF